MGSFLYFHDVAFDKNDCRVEREKEGGAWISCMPRLAPPGSRSFHLLMLFLLQNIKQRCKILLLVPSSLGLPSLKSANFFFRLRRVPAHVTSVTLPPPLLNDKEITHFHTLLNPCKGKMPLKTK